VILAVEAEIDRGEPDRPVLLLASGTSISPSNSILGLEI